MASNQLPAKAQAALGLPDGFNRELHMQEITAEYVRSVLSYDPITGALTWIRSVGKRSYVGLRAGCIGTGGYRHVNILKQQLAEHRVIWLYMNGRWPKDEIDHINLIRDDNTWANLREADRANNSFNSPAHKDNRSGTKGVSWNKKRNKWVAQISINGRQTNLGRYFTKEEAHAAYRSAAALHRGEFARY